MHRFLESIQTHAANYGGKVVAIPADTKTFQLNLDILDEKINELHQVAHSK